MIRRIVACSVIRSLVSLFVAGALVPACGEPSVADGTEGGASSGGSSSEETGPEPPPARCEPISVPATDERGAQQLQRIATADEIPGLGQQPTAHGRILGSLLAFDGRLHLGYGDYSDNTGPIAMHAWDPGEEAFVDLGVLPTEEVLWFRPGADVLYSPAIDPDGHQEEGGVYRLGCGAEAWEVGTPIEGAVHVYDVAVRGETIYAGTGSLSGEPARLMESPDGGDSWTEVLRHGSAGDRFSRFYFVGATDELLFVSGQEHPDPDVPLAWVRRGDGDFEALVDPPAGLLVPITLGSSMMVAAFSGNPGRGRYLAGYRIEGDRLVADEPWPVIEGEIPTLVAWASQPADERHPERLLTLLRTSDDRSHIARTDDPTLGPEGWQVLMTLEPLAGGDAHVSMALLLGDLYLGTRLGALDVVHELDAPRE